jgi:hypothetical protein
MADRLGYCVRAADSFWACAKKTPADGFLNERERLLRLTRFYLARLRAELYRSQSKEGSRVPTGSVFTAGMSTRNGR